MLPERNLKKKGIYRTKTEYYSARVCYIITFKENGDTQIKHGDREKYQKRNSGSSCRS